MHRKRKQLETRSAPPSRLIAFGTKRLPNQLGSPAPCRDGCHEKARPARKPLRTCVYRKLKSERSDGEARRGLGVNESFRPDESGEKSAHPCAETDGFWRNLRMILECGADLPRPKQ